MGLVEDRGLQILIAASSECYFSVTKDCLTLHYTQIDIAIVQPLLV